MVILLGGNRKEQKLSGYFPSARISKEACKYGFS
jgi:hypothetical protein